MTMPWEYMSAAEVFAGVRALRDDLASAPKVAGPWEPPSPNPSGGLFPSARFAPDGSPVCWERDGEVGVHSWALGAEDLFEPVLCSSRDEADGRLRGAGWVLV